MATPATAPTLSSTEKQRAFIRWKRQQDARRLAELQQKLTNVHGSDTRMRRRHPLFFDSDGSTFADAEPSPSLPSPASAALENTGDDTDEDELMRMIMEKERREEAKERAQATALRRKARPLLVPRTDDFYSPVRPADASANAPLPEVSRAPFRVGRVVNERCLRKEQQQANRTSDIASNQAEDDAEEQPRRERVRLQTADDAWDHFVSGMSSDSAAVSPCHPNPSPLSAASQPRTHVFREEISTSRSRPLSHEPPPVAPKPSAQSQPPSTNYSAVSIPTVSYTPPMSPAASGSSRQPQQQSTDRSRMNSSAGNDNPEDRTYAAVREQYRHLYTSPAVFPLWNLVVLVAFFVVVGLTGYYVEDVLTLMSKVSSRASAVSLSLSKAEQQQMHARLEQLQSELHGFRHTASEIETHSLRVFDEVKTHLVRMKSEREKHQDAIAREMNDLRVSMLHMMRDLVEQERALIHARLQQLAAVTADRRGVDTLGRADAQDRVQRVEEGTVHVEPKSSAQVVDVHTSESPASSSATAAAEDAAPTEPAANATRAPPAKRAGLSRGESVLLLSWELLMMLTGMSVLGGFVGIRVRNINRRKRWFDQRRERRVLQAQLARARAERLGEVDDESDDASDATESATDHDDVAVDDMNSERTDDAEGWSDSATESGVETVSLMRLATDRSPMSQDEQRRVRLRASSSDVEDDVDGGKRDESDDGDESLQSPTRQKAEVRLRSCRLG